MVKSKLERALEVAATAHVTQKRKGTGTPYIVHPVSVMLIAGQVTTDQDTLCACLLHDVLEDGDLAKYAEGDMQRDFGPAVLAIVKAVTKDDSIKDWRQRNQAYIDNLEAHGNIAAFTICCADKIHNLKTTLADYAMLGEDLWSRFNAGKADQQWWYRSVLALQEAKLPGSPLVAELRDLVKQLEEL